ncbi:MAG TPA: NfeD family protein, partial [bacterium]|nr:NfeD family protein [bacterium]
LDGRLVKTSSGPVTLAVAQATIDDEPMTPRERLFVMLADPTLIAILLGIAMLGLYTEFQHPGAILPAVVGSLAFLALLVGIQVVPIHYAGLLLIAIGFGCFVLEIKITSYGLLTVAGISAIVGGLFLLVDKSRFTVPVSWSVAVPGLGSMALIAAFLTWLAARAMRSTPLGDDRELVGRVVRAHTALSPAGTVTLDGVFWKAVSTRPVEAGASVRIVAAKGLLLEVEPAPAEAAPPVSFVAGGSAT